EKRFRRLSAYPPEVSLLAVVTAGEDVKRTEKGAEGLKELIFDFIKKEIQFQKLRILKLFSLYPFYFSIRLYQ
ncbi:hypothetical protein, partial [Filifactor alocis]